MKKYLIKGLMALVVGGFAASCADDNVEYVPLDQQKAVSYEKAFKELIGGDVDPNHDWGFTQTSIIEEPSAARTRYVDVNGNMWKDHPTLGETEGKDVKNWVNYTRAQLRAANKNFYETCPVNLQNYWVTQVWKGTDTYSDLDKHSGILGSDKMNNLHIKQQSSGTISNVSEPAWYHVNNFNAGDNTDWWGNTLVLNSGTYDFAYHGAEDSKYHNKWIIVRGADIKQEYAGYYYVCFDFEQTIGNPTTKFQVNVKSPYRDENLSFEVEISGAYENAYQIYASGYTTYTGSVLNPTTNTYETHTWNLTEANIQWNQVLNGNQCVAANDVYTDWIIRLVDANPNGGGSSSSTSTRTDRIERRRLVQQGRVFCEDLGTNNITTSDIDFNDAVFDAKIWRYGQFDIYYLNNNYNGESDYLENIYQEGINGQGIDYNVQSEDVIVNGKFKYIAEICLLAAGGTVPLKIGGNNGFEIHDKFGVSHTTIVNTYGTPSKDNFTTTVQTATSDQVSVLVDITNIVKERLENHNTNIGLDIIPIEVQWVSGDRNTVGELTAEFGQVPQKLCVPIGTRWVYERIPIASTNEKNGAYDMFGAYAQNRTPLFWEVENSINPNLLYPGTPAGMTPEANCTNNISGNPYEDVVVTQGSTTVETVNETVLWQGQQTYGENGPNQNLTLYSTTFHEGEYIRLYGTNNGGWMTLHNESWTPIISPSLNFANGYADTILNATQAADLSNGPLLQIAARNCVITKICKVSITRTTN